jgi:hypothetical protein
MGREREETMKIAVTRCDGDIEIIILTEPVRVFEGSTQAHIHSADGMDHYFTKPDGFYDGWGRGLPDEGWTQQQATTMLDEIKNQRMIISLTFARFIGLRVKRIRRFLQWWTGYLLQQPGYPKFGSR